MSGKGAAAALQQGNPIAEPSIDTSRAVVLLVDDQPMVAEGIRRLLSDEDDIQFHYCSDPAKAVETAIEVKATTILQDLVMPDVDGMTLVRFFRGHPQTKDIPVIVLSSKEDPKIKRDAFERGASDYLVKLPDQIELIARIRAHSRNHLIQVERDAAFQVMREMQKQLEQSNQQLEASNQELQRLSSLDGLTGISNRRNFDEYINREWLRGIREHRQIALVLVDIDYFKLFNDTYGHQGGDDCLRSVANALAGTVYRPSDLVARYGGEEFVAVLAETMLDGAQAVAERMQAAVRGAGLVHEASRVADHVTLSIGVASVMPSSDRTPQQLIEAADKALYRAKQAGRNQVVSATAEDFDSE
jgi:two-component system chemotaxis family response regulator WspR